MTVAWFALALTAIFAIAPQAPLPERLTNAKSIYLVNDAGNLKAFDKLVNDLQVWGRFKIPLSREKADLVGVLTSSEQYVYSVQFGSATATTTQGTTTAQGSGMSIPVNAAYLHLKIFDPSNGDPLWSDRVSVGLTANYAPTQLVKHLRDRMAGRKQP